MHNSIPKKVTFMQDDAPCPHTLTVLPSTLIIMSRLQNMPSTLTTMIISSVHMLCLPLPIMFRDLLARFSLPLLCLLEFTPCFSQVTIIRRPKDPGLTLTLFLFSLYYLYFPQSLDLDQNTMLIQYYNWLSSLSFIALAIGHAYPAIGLKPRYLATGTGVSLPSTSAPPYPTGTANGTAISTGSTANATATPTPIPPTERFFLVVADSGTTLDGNYIQFSGNTQQTGLLVLYPRPKPDDFTYASSLLFKFNEDGTLAIQEYTLIILSIITYPPLILAETGPYEIDPGFPYAAVFCEDVDGNLACRGESRTVFSICPDDFPYDGFTGGTVDLGPTVEPGCAEVTLRIVPYGDQ